MFNVYKIRRAVGILLVFFFFYSFSHWLYLVPHCVRLIFVVKSENVLISFRFFVCNLILSTCSNLKLKLSVVTSLLEQIKTTILQIHLNLFFLSDLYGSFLFGFMFYVMLMMNVVCCVYGKVFSCLECGFVLKMNELHFL